MAFLLQDLTHAIRQLRQRPLFTLTAVVTLAIGMGVNAVAFTVVNGVLFRGFARNAASGVGRIATTPGSDEGGNASLEEFRRFAESARGAADVAAEGRLAVNWWPFRTVSWLFSICGTLALVLAASGLAGVVVHAVARRTREFGVRVSIGATPRDLVAEVLRGSAGLLLPGLIAGTLLAAVAARLIRVALFGVNPLNPTTYLAVALLECVIVAAASIGPALRAARVDPLVALRSE